jgi:UDPglucose 6-dehydrogenase
MPKTSVKRVSVVGLGKLGLCLAAVLASRGFDVSGVETDESKVDAVNLGTSPIYEPGLDELIKKNHKRLAAATDYEKISETGVTFVVVPTPSDETGAFSLRFVSEAMESIGKELAKKHAYHLVVLTSTVMPHSMDKAVVPTLEEASGRVVGKDFGVCYNPEFIALGDVIHGLLAPDFILIGESDPKAGRTLTSIQERVCENSPPIERMNFINAEISKIAVNSYVTMKMTFANTLAEISEKTPGADVDAITKALGRDRRIGGAYLKGALGYGGTCFPRDNIAFTKFATDTGAQARLAQVTHDLNVGQVRRVVAFAQNNGLKPTDRVGILGLSFKPNTNIVEQSQSIMIARDLAARGHDVNVYDPAAMDSARSILGTGVAYHNNVRDCLKASEFVIVATPWSEFSDLTPALLRGKIVLDCWRSLPSVIPGATVVRLGVGRK